MPALIGIIRGCHAYFDWNCCIVTFMGPDSGFNSCFDWTCYGLSFLMIIYSLKEETTSVRNVALFPCGLSLDEVGKHLPKTAVLFKYLGVENIFNCLNLYFNQIMNSPWRTKLPVNKLHYRKSPEILFR